MSKLKRMLSLALATAMTLCSGMFTTMATADDTITYTITINGSSEGHVYQAYQIFKGALSTVNGATVLTDIDWGSGVDSDKYDEIYDGWTAGEQDVASLVAAINDKNAADFAQDIGAYLSEDYTTSENGTISGLEPGYYLIKDVVNEAVTDAYSSYILEVVGNVEVEPKSDVPTVTKKVKDVNDSTGVTTEWQDSADYDIGDYVPFKLEATLPNNIAEYSTYTLVFHDTLSSGFDNVSADDIKVYLNDGTTLEDGKYTVNIKPDDGCSFEVTINDVKDYYETYKPSTIRVEYTAKLNEDAVIGNGTNTIKGNPNSVKLEYSNNPNYDETSDTDVDGEDDKGEKKTTGETTEDIVTVFTYNVVINKVDGNDEELGGAKFVLYKWDSASGDWVNVETGDEDEIFKKEGSKFTFKGIDDGIYKLSEVETPEGYNGVNDMVFKVEAQHIDDCEDDTTKLTTKLTATAIIDETTLKETYGVEKSDNIELSTDTDNSTLEANVINNKGTTLPSTGGMGTRVIYLIGGVLVLAAGVLLITKRRMSSEK